MKHLFVPYDLALKLKAKGFDEPCIGIYSSDGEIMTSGGVSSFKKEHTYYKENGAILYQQVLDWFEDHDIYIYAIRMGGRWQWKRDVSLSYDDFSRGEGYATKYEALAIAIEEALKLI